MSLLGDSDAAHFLRETYQPGETLGTAFARLYARIFADWGVIVLDASDGELDRVAEPIYRAAIERADELSSALLARGEALEAAGYHQQVKVTSSSVLLFTLQQGARTAIHRRVNGDSSEFVIGNDAGAEKLSQGDLLNRIVRVRSCSVQMFSCVPLSRIFFSLRSRTPEALPKLRTLRRPARSTKRCLVA